jgi:hypothetical protein
MFSDDSSAERWFPRNQNPPVHAGGQQKKAPDDAGAFELQV